MRQIKRALHIPMLDGINADCIDVGLDVPSPTYALHYLHEESSTAKSGRESCMSMTAVTARGSAVVYHVV